MNSTVEDQSPQQGEAPHIARIIEVVSLVAANGEWPIERWEGGRLVIARGGVGHAINEAGGQVLVLGSGKQQHRTHLMLSPLCASHGAVGCLEPRTDVGSVVGSALLPLAPAPYPANADASARARRHILRKLAAAPLRTIVVLHHAG